MFSIAQYRNGARYSRLVPRGTLQRPACVSSAGRQRVTRWAQICSPRVFSTSLRAIVPIEPARICCLTWKWNFIPKRSAFRRIRSEIRLHQSARACRGTLIALWRKTRGMRLADSAVRNLKYNHRTTPGTGRDLPNPNPEPFVACGGRRAGTVCGIGAARSIDK